MDRHKLIGHLHCLWWWALDNADIDGTLPVGTTAKILAIGAEIPARSADKFLNTLIYSGFIDEVSENKAPYFSKKDPKISEKSILYRLHNWYEYAGKLNEQRQLTKEEKRLGGIQRMAFLTPEQRSELAKQAAEKRWRGCQQDASTHLAKMPATVPNPTVPTILKESIERKESPRTLGECQNVKMTSAEYEKLVARFGAQGATDWIQELSLAKASKGYKTKSDYATILVWERYRRKSTNQMQEGRQNGTHQQGSQRGPHRLPDKYTRPEDLRLDFGNAGRDNHSSGEDVSELHESTGDSKEPQGIP